MLSEFAACWRHIPSSAGHHRPKQKLVLRAQDGFFALCHSVRRYIFDAYNEDKKKGRTDVPNWLAKAVDKFYAADGNPKPKKASVKIPFDTLYDKFL